MPSRAALFHTSAPESAQFTGTEIVALATAGLLGFKTLSFCKGQRKR